MSATATALVVTESTSELVVFLVLGSTAAGAHLPVCDLTCAGPARDVLGDAVAGQAVAPPAPDPAASCLRCVWCGVLLQPRPFGQCLWHPHGCPRSHLTHTLTAAAVAHRLATRDRVLLDDVALIQLEETLHVLTDPATEHPDADEVYGLLRPLLGLGDGEG